MKKIFSVYGLAFVAVILIIAIAITSSFIHVNMTRKAHVEKAYATVTELASRENIDDLVLTIYISDGSGFSFIPDESLISDKHTSKKVLKGEEIRPILESYKQLTPEQLVSVYPEDPWFGTDSYYIFKTENEEKILEIACGSSAEWDYETDTVTISQSYVIINGMYFEDHFNQFTQ